MPPCRRVLICGGVSEEALNAGLDDGLNARLNGGENLVRRRTFRPGRDQEAGTAFPHPALASISSS